MRRRTYKDPSSQRIYDGYVDIWLRGPTGKRGELFMEDGTPRLGGSSFRIAFWHGFGARLAPPHAPRTVGAAIFMAGKDCAVETRRRVRRVASE